MLGATPQGFESLILRSLTRAKLRDGRSGLLAAVPAVSVPISYHRSLHKVVEELQRPAEGRPPANRPAAADRDCVHVSNPAAADGNRHEQQHEGSQGTPSVTSGPVAKTLAKED